MKIKLLTAISSLFTLALPNSAMAQVDIFKMAEIDRFCFQYSGNPLCENKETYISLEKWEKNKTVCSLTTEWDNEEKKCKVVAGDRELIIYVEQDVISEDLSNTLKTKVIKISLDKIFAFNTQWWLADFKGPVTHANNIYGTFTELQIGFMSASNSSKHPTSKFLTISAKNLHQVLEQIESWRYYLPDLTTFEERLRPKPSSSDRDIDISHNIAKLEETNECPFCDLRNADLTGMNLKKANLQGANLEGANLEKVELEQAYLLGANLNKTNLNNANLETTNMMFASLIKANLVEANLRGANLQHTNFKNANLSKAQLNAKKFQVTYLKNANLSGANLSDADLRCANLQSASLKKANLSNANLSLCQEELSSGSVELSNLRLNNRGTLSNLRLNEAPNFFFGLLKIFSYLRGDIDLSAVNPKVTFYLRSDLSSANLNGANLTDANLENAQLTDANLSKAIFDNTKLSQNNLSNANFINTDVSKVKFKNPFLICEAIFSDESIYKEHCQKEEEVEEKD